MPHSPPSLDSAANTLVDALADYIVVAEKSAKHLRQPEYDTAWVAQLWEEQQAIFLSDSVKYPSIFPAPHDTEGRNKFRAQCQALCFPPETQKPSRPQDYIMMYFGAVAGMHIATEEADNHPHCTNLCGVASDRANTILHELYPDSAANPDELEDDDEIGKARQGIEELINETICCHDKRSGQTIEYLVVDYINSLVGGDYLVLEDNKGRRHNITPEELHEIRIQVD